MYALAKLNIRVSRKIVVGQFIILGTIKLGSSRICRQGLTFCAKSQFIGEYRRFIVIGSIDDPG
jgi:hypothetical protein